jgi:hypothetical protein
MMYLDLRSFKVDRLKVCGDMTSFILGPGLGCLIELLGQLLPGRN